MNGLYRWGHYGRHSINVSPPGAVGAPEVMPLRELIALYHAAKANPRATFPRGLRTSQPSTGAEILAEIRAEFRASINRGYTTGFYRPDHAARRGNRRIKPTQPGAAAAWAKGYDLTLGAGALHAYGF